ncbi:MAG: DUF5680 domain-containing protein [Burkholderiaceae bacterium]
MRPSISISELRHFLLAAKQSTYAAQGDDASVIPLLSDSKQLEYHNGELFYRDIYVGMWRFTGQEIVYSGEYAIWSMSYAGGICTNVETSTASQVYTFLRQALNNAPPELPLRGPHLLTNDAMRYTCECTGSIEQFYGVETITSSTQCLYQLHFSGGNLA